MEIYMSKIEKQITEKVSQLGADFEGAQALIDANLDSISGGNALFRQHISDGTCPEDCGGW